MTNQILHNLLRHPSDPIPEQPDEQYTFHRLGEEAGTLGLTRDELHRWADGHSNANRLQHRIHLAAERIRVEEQLSALDSLIVRRRHRMDTLESNLAVQRVTNFGLLFGFVLMVVLLASETVFSYATLAYGINLDGLEGWITALGLTAVIASLDVFLGPLMIRPFLSGENRSRWTGVIYTGLFVVILTIGILLFSYLGAFRTTVLAWTGDQSFSGYLITHPDQVNILLIVLSLFYLLGGAVVVAHFRELIGLRARQRQLYQIEREWSGLQDDWSELRARHEAICREQEWITESDEAYFAQVRAEVEAGWLDSGNNTHDRPESNDPEGGDHGNDTYSIRGTRSMVDRFFREDLQRLMQRNDHQH